MRVFYEARLTSDFGGRAEVSGGKTRARPGRVPSDFPSMYATRRTNTGSDTQASVAHAPRCAMDAGHATKSGRLPRFLDALLFR